MEEAGALRKPIIVPPEQGRVYAMGRICAIFKADSDESAGRYSVSEWWLEPRTRGRGCMRIRRTTCSTSLLEP
jgi:hypothetical protein